MGGHDWISRLGRWLGLLLLGFIVFSILWVVAYRFINPPITSRMISVWLERDKLNYTWRDIEDIDRNLPRAVIAGEDARFCSHNGFDFEGIRHALQSNLKGKKLKGGSTVSQQTAKNVFLWSARSWVRKGLEVWFTLLIENIWGKKRIMEVYLNVAEFGIGSFGADAATRHYFNHGPEKISKTEAGRLVAVLPSPIKRDAKRPRGYTKKYARNITRWIRVVERDQTDFCLR